MKKICMIVSTLMGLLTGCSQYVSYTETLNLNGQQIFCSVEGRGKPIVLIHGNGGSHSDLETMQRQLAQAGYCVYALDSRGQGCNPPLTEYHYSDMAEDVYALIQNYKLKRPAIYGWSDGGIIALLLESLHPGTCSLIATSGANITAENAIDPELFDNIFGTSEDIDSLPPLVRMMRLEPNMTYDDIQRIRTKVMVCAGEHDLILPEHTRMIAEWLPDSELRIIEGEDHGSYIYHNKLMGDILIDFLKRNKY